MDDDDEVTSLICNDDERNSIRPRSVTNNTMDDEADLDTILTARGQRLAYIDLKAHESVVDDTSFELRCFLNGSCLFIVEQLTAATTVAMLRNRLLDYCTSKVEPEKQKNAETLGRYVNHVLALSIGNLLDSSTPTPRPSLSIRARSYLLLRAEPIILEDDNATVRSAMEQLAQPQLSASGSTLSSSSIVNFSLLFLKRSLLVAETKQPVLLYDRLACSVATLALALAHRSHPNSTAIPVALPGPATFEVLSHLGQGAFGMVRCWPSRSGARVRLSHHANGESETVGLEGSQSSLG